MKINKLLENDAFKLISKTANLDREIKGVECCDLLSWVMANGKEDEAWITVQIHSNIIAVATLLDFACIIVPENIEVVMKSSAIGHAFNAALSHKRLSANPHELGQALLLALSDESAELKWANGEQVFELIPEMQ